VVGKRSVPIHAPVDDRDLCTLRPCSTNPFLGTPLPSSSSALHSAKAPSASAYTIQWSTHGRRRSPKNMLFASMRLLLVRRGQPSCEGLPLPFGRPEVNR